MKVLVLTLIAMSSLFKGCQKEPDGEWCAFNQAHDELAFKVTDGAPSEEPSVIDLTSTTGEVVIGQLTATPGTAPVGTRVRLVVHVFGPEEDTDATIDWDRRVKRVEVDAETADRGTRTFAMIQDSARKGVWVLDLQSYGVEGEVRTDTFRVHLYEYVTPPGGACIEPDSLLRTSDVSMLSDSVLSPPQWKLAQRVDVDTAER